MILKYPKCDEIAKSQQNMSVQDVNGWVSVKDKLPDIDGLFLVHYEHDNRFYTDCSYFRVLGKTFICMGSQIEFMPTHWQPLPKPPTIE